MSQDRTDDFYMMPDLDDMDTSWLDYLDDTSPSRPAQPRQPRPGHDPAQTRIEPTRSEASTPLRDGPSQSRRDPAAAKRRDGAPQNRREPAPVRRDPYQLHREPTQTRRTPAQSRPVPPQGRPVSNQGRPPMPPRPNGPSGSYGQPPRPAYKPRRRRRSSAPLIALIVILVGGMAFAGWQLGSIFLNYHRDRSAYNDLAAHAISELSVPETAAGPDDPEDPEQQQIHTVSEVSISVDWDYLRSVNPNIVGWLYCPGTVISYPVVQSSDHEYYLSHSFDGQPNVSGTLFADRNSVPGITQSNYIIYGHNMKDHSMFGTFSNYVNKSYYDANPVMYYLTPDTDYRVELVCAHIAEATIENFPTYFSSIEAYQGYLSRISSNAFWVNYDYLNTAHQLISMSTCTSGSGYTDPRFLLHGMLIPLA